MSKQKKRAKQSALNRLVSAIEAGRVIRTVHTDLLLRGHDEDFQDTPSEWPTSAMCGSPEKVQVMRLRVELGQSLWHPCDSTEQVVNERGPSVLALREIFFLSIPARRKSLS